MKAKFWIEKWEEGNFGWHQESLNRVLLDHWPKLELKASSKVLVPLCGKSKDMVYFTEQGHNPRVLITLKYKLNRQRIVKDFRRNRNKKKPS